VCLFIITYTVSYDDEQEGNTALLKAAALISASEDGFVEIAQVLIDAGAALDIQNNVSVSPLSCYI
jgi:hypothetical protein